MHASKRRSSQQVTKPSGRGGWLKRTERNIEPVGEQRKQPRQALEQRQLELVVVRQVVQDRPQADLCPSAHGVIITWRLYCSHAHLESSPVTHNSAKLSQRAHGVPERARGCVLHRAGTRLQHGLDHALMLHDGHKARVRQPDGRLVGPAEVLHKQLHNLAAQLREPLQLPGRPTPL